MHLAPTTWERPAACLPSTRETRTHTHTYSKAIRAQSDFCFNSYFGEHTISFHRSMALSLVGRFSFPAVWIISTRQLLYTSCQAAPHIIILITLDECAEMPISLVKKSDISVINELVSYTSAWSAFRCWVLAFSLLSKKFLFDIDNTRCYIQLIRIKDCHANNLEFNTMKLKFYKKTLFICEQRKLIREIYRQGENQPGMNLKSNLLVLLILYKTHANFYGH